MRHKLSILGLSLLLFGCDTEPCKIVQPHAWTDAEVTMFNNCVNRNYSPTYCRDAIGR